MSIFKKNSKASGRHQVKLELMFDELAKNALAFGLQWRSIVTSGGRDAAAAIARAQGATHYLFRGQQVGFGTIDVKSNPQLATGTAVYPAAQVAARQYGGDAVFALQIGSGEYWLALIRNGSPTSNDTFLTDSNDAAALEKAQEIVKAVGSEDVKLVAYTNISDPGFTCTVRPASPEDLLLAINEEDHLSPLPKPPKSIPVPVLVVLGLCALILVGQKGYKWWDARQRAALAARNVVADEDPSIAWARNIAQWESTKATPQADGLRQARESMGQVPVLWDGWRLSTTKCSTAEPAPGAKPLTARPWSCNAMYDRQPGARVTRDMVREIPAGWKVTFKPLDKMQVNWQFEQQIKPLKIAEFKAGSFHLVETNSLLQTLAPGFSQDLAFEFAPISIPAPKRKSGGVVPTDPSIVGLKQASLDIKAPLRTIDALIESGVVADWTSLTLVFAANGTNASSLSIKTSAINAEATGVIYAKN